MVPPKQDPSPRTSVQPLTRRNRCAAATWQRSTQVRCPPSAFVDSHLRGRDGFADGYVLHPPTDSAPSFPRKRESRLDATQAETRACTWSAGTDLKPRPPVRNQAFWSSPSRSAQFSKRGFTLPTATRGVWLRSCVRARKARLFWPGYIVPFLLRCSVPEGCSACLTRGRWYGIMQVGSDRRGPDQGQHPAYAQNLVCVADPQGIRCPAGRRFSYRVYKHCGAKKLLRHHRHRRLRRS